MTKFLGIILASIFSVILIVQVTQVNAQTAQEPISGPITSPLTAPMQSLTPTITPTPSLISTLTSTPILTATITPTPSLTSVPTVTPTPTITPTETPSVTPTITPIPSATPTPLPAGSTRLGGLNLDGYCSAVGKPWDILANNTWSCSNGAAPIDMTEACVWQYNQNGVFSNQDIQNDPYSWSCYVPQSSITPTITAAITITMTPTQAPTATPTPTDDIQPTVSAEPTITDIPAKKYHKKEIMSFSFIHFPKGFPFVVNAANFFNHSHEDKKPILKTCSIHDRM